MTTCCDPRCFDLLLKLKLTLPGFFVDGGKIDHLRVDRHPRGICHSSCPSICQYLIIYVICYVKKYFHVWSEFV